jgi:serine/threonine-protein kinase HipA
MAVRQVRDLVVLLAGRRAGELHMRNGSLSFVYDDEYANARNALRISVSMPLQEGVVYGQKAVLPWLSGLLPDNVAVLVRWANHFGVSANSPFALLAHMGKDCAGAVQFCAEVEVDGVLGRNGTLRPVSDAEIAQRLQLLHVIPSEWATERERWSLAGAQSKFALTSVDGEWFEASGAAATTHIIKPGISDYPSQALNEHICLSAARLLGIDAAETDYRLFESEPALVVTRFDRTPSRERLHQEDLCQALSVMPNKKYQDDGGPGIAKICDLLNAESDEQSVFRFLETVAFNCLMGAPDAHAKNYSIFLTPAGAHLTPQYDIASGLPYQPRNPRAPGFTRSAMAVNGQWRFADVTDDDWAAVATRARIDSGRLVDRVHVMATQLSDAVATVVGATPLAHGDETVTLLRTKVAESTQRYLSLNSH